MNFGVEDPDGKLNLARKYLQNLIQEQDDKNIPEKGKKSKNGIPNIPFLKKVKKIFIIGNLISQPDDSDLVEKGSYAKQKLNSMVYSKILQSYEEADNFLNICSNTKLVYLMPGEKDIASSYFPQGKLSELILMHSRSNINRSLFLKANPFNLELFPKEEKENENEEKISYLITSGQNIDNIRKYTLINKIYEKKENSALKIMEKIIDWGHLCPSAPDTLRTWPVKKEDPLVLKEIPNVFIAGNQKFFEEDFIRYKNSEELVRLISVPNFKETYSFVVLNPNNLEAFEYKIQIEIE